MCAIAGVVRFPHLFKTDEASARAMQAALRHRGPDGEGISLTEKSALVQTRLALLDPRPLKLPLVNARGIEITYNGEVYNHRELRTRLSSRYSFETQTDTEVLLAAYEIWGPSFVERLDGIFSFFIWDSRSSTGFAARDPMGVKPFFYVTEENFFAFASEASALVNAKIRPFRVREEALAEVLTAPSFSGASQTPFAGVEILGPGETLSFDEGRLRKKTYFRFQWQEAPGAGDRSADLEEALTRAVRENATADFPVGLFLSGGLDSTLLAALAPRPLPTWTLHFTDNEAPDFTDALIVKSDDFPFAQKAARELGLDEHIVTVAPVDYEEALLRTLRRNDLICAWEQEVSQDLLAKAASQKVKAVMVGDAADETHFGYPFLMRTENVRSPRHILSFFGTVPLNKNLMTDPVRHFDEVYRLYAENAGHTWQNESSQRLATSRLIVDLWLRRLLHNGDIHTMTHSLEARAPFTQRAVLQWAQRLRYQAGPEKAHLREIASRHMSPELALRPKSALTKNLKARRVIHELFTREWREAGELLAPFVDADEISKWSERESQTLSDRDSGLEFRVLATLIWRKRFL